MALQKGFYQFALLPRGYERAHFIAQNLKVLNQTGLMNTSEAVRKKYRKCICFYYEYAAATMHTGLSKLVLPYTHG